MNKIMKILTIFVIGLIPLASAVDFGANLADNIAVKVNDEPVVAGVSLAVEEGEELDVEVTIINNDGVNYENLHLKAIIGGYEDGIIESETETFDLADGTIKKRSLEIATPRDIESKEYTLQVQLISDSDIILKEYELSLESPRHSIEVVGLDFAPSNVVEAGRSLFPIVELENFGKVQEDDVKITVSIPELGVRAVKFVDEVVDNSRDDVPQFFLPIPADARSGNYEVEVEVRYDRNKVVRSSEMITVVGKSSESVDEQVSIRVGQNTVSAKEGQNVVFPLAIVNSGTQSRIFSISANSNLPVSLSESLVVINAGESKIVQVIAQANENVETISVNVAENGQVEETLSLTVVGEESSSLDVRSALEYAVIALFAVLVILAVVVMVKLGKKNDDEETYY